MPSSTRKPIAAVSAPSPPASAPRSPGQLGSWAVFAAVVTVTTAADLITKAIAFERLGMPGMKPGTMVIPNMLWWETNLNEGALFGLGQGMGWLFITVSLAALLGIVVAVSSLRLPGDGILVVALALISGGILGNLYDRLGLPDLVWHAPLAREGQPVYAVRDFIHFRLEGVIDWPIFNLADSFLVAGAGLLLLLAMLPTTGQRPFPAAIPGSGTATSPEGNTDA
jgi:signal peptidase II